MKHLTRAHLDEKMTALIDQHGHEAYGFYWHLCEVVGESMDKTDKCELTHSMGQWCRLLMSHHHVVKKYFAVLSTLTVTPPVTPPSTPLDSTLVNIIYQSGNVTVKIPKLLKYRDEYSQKSRQAPDTFSENSRPRLEIENIDKEEPPIVPLAGDLFTLESQSSNGSEKAAQSNQPKPRSGTKRVSPTMTIQQREDFRLFMTEHPKGNIQVVSAEKEWAEKVVDQAITAFVMECLRREKAGDVTYMLGPWRWLKDHLALYANGVTEQPTIIQQPKRETRTERVTRLMEEQEANRAQCR